MVGCVVPSRVSLSRPLSLVVWAAVARPPWARRLLPSRAPRNLLLVSLDTLRADRLGSYGYAGAQTPRLDALARSGLRFEKATTVVPLTLPAHSSLLTGTFPAWHGVRDNGGFYLGDEQVTLAEVLRDKGFRTGGFVASFVLDRRWGIAQGFERYFDEFDLERFKDTPEHGRHPAPRGRGRGQGPRVAAAPTGTSPSSPGCTSTIRTRRTKPPSRTGPAFPRTLHGAYDAEIAYTDSQVGRLLDALELDGRLAETLVVVLGDHGEMLGEHGEQTHGFFIYEAATHIPLIVCGPGRARSRRPRPGADGGRHADGARPARGGRHPRPCRA